VATGAGALTRRCDRRSAARFRRLPARRLARTRQPGDVPGHPIRRPA